KSFWVLEVIDSETYQVVRRLRVPPSVEELATAPASGLAVVWEGREGHARLLDLKAGRVLESVLPSTGHSVMSPGGQFVYPGRDNKVEKFRVERSGLKREGQSPSLKAGVSGLRLSPDGKYLAVRPFRVEGRAPTLVFATADLGRLSLEVSTGVLA